jgi:hypothetical protein
VDHRDQPDHRDKLDHRAREELKVALVHLVTRATLGLKALPAPVETLVSPAHQVPWEPLAQLETPALRELPAQLSLAHVVRLELQDYPDSWAILGLLEELVLPDQWEVWEVLEWLETVELLGTPELREVLDQLEA